MDELLYHGKVSARKKLKEKEICFNGPSSCTSDCYFHLRQTKKNLWGYKIPVSSGVNTDIEEKLFKWYTRLRYYQLELKV